MLRFNEQIARYKVKMLVVTTLAIMLLSLATTTRTVNGQQFSMPEEQVNYTITQINGTLWAKIDGIYPITYTGKDTAIPMVYPTPPGTTNIIVWLNDVELGWSNFSEAYPDSLHHTAIGNWSMISTLLPNVSGSFVLRIHYEHPVQVINGSYVFLYDLNIQEYLSALENKSVAHFTITMDTDYLNLKVSTVDVETEMLKPIAFTVSSGKPSEIKVDEISEFGKSLPGDLLISFSETAANNGSELLVVVSASVAGILLAGLVGYFFVRRRRNSANSMNDS